MSYTSGVKTDVKVTWLGNGDKSALGGQAGILWSLCRIYASHSAFHTNEYHPALLQAGEEQRPKQ